MPWFSVSTDDFYPDVVGYFQVPDYSIHAFQTTTMSIRTRAIIAVREMHPARADLNTVVSPNVIDNISVEKAPSRTSVAMPALVQLARHIGRKVPT